MTAHKHAEMIKAKADNMELVVFKEGDANWFEINYNIINLLEDKNYFLCLPQHKDACLHWLNGGTISDVSKATNWYVDENGLKNVVWRDNTIFMSEDYNLSIKPRKEKRYLMVQPKTGVCTNHFSTKERALDCVASTDDRWQLIEIEVEI